MSYYAQALRAFVAGDESPMITNHWHKEGLGLTFEDYWIYVRMVGHRKYRMYNEAHWRDSDIVDKSDVWNALRKQEVVS